jgi:hypothetical protein
MTIAPALEKLLTQLPPADQLQFQSLLEAVFTTKYTGFIGLHCFNGIPKQVDLGSPIRLSIVEGLDKPPKVDAS